MSPWALHAGIEPEVAIARLGGLVRDLTRARRLQLLVEFVCVGSFFGLIVACAVVLSLRLAALPHSGWQVAAWLLGAALVAAATLAWRRRPDDLEVAILADIALKLEQKLSTAWEFVRREPHAVVTQRLAIQAIRERMPTRHLVFPLRLNTWGRLTPVAALLLALVSLVDLRIDFDEAAGPSDVVVADEGERLHEYGRRMAERARRESLPRSLAQAESMQRLGERMRSGELTRRQALSRLRDLDAALDRHRRAALSEGVDAGPGRIDARSLAGLPILSGGLASALLSKLLEGRLEPGDLDALTAEAGDLSALGITNAELEEALENFAAGDSEALRELLEDLSQTGEAVNEALELLDAQQIVQLARENLGDAEIRLRVPGDAPNASEGAQGTLYGMLSERRLGGPRGETGAYLGDRGSGQDAGDNSGQLRSPSPRSNAQPTAGVLKPKGQSSEGPVFTTEARVLPRLGAATVETVALDARYQAQIEAVLSRQSYPLHQKELVRRYFLSLTEGVRPDDETEP